jgi:hypothetical protein
MTNVLTELDNSARWHLMVQAGIQGAEGLGYTLKRQPGRGLSNTYEVTKDGKTQIASVRTTRDRWVAFPPLEGGKKWKTLDDADLVLVSSVDDRENPKFVEVYLFPANEVRKRFNASYHARLSNGHTMRDNYGMWVTLDRGDDEVPTQVGHSLAIDYPYIARFAIDDLIAELDLDLRKRTDPASVEVEEEVIEDERPALATVADVLTFAREQIAALTGMPIDTIKLDVKIGS